MKPEEKKEHPIIRGIINAGMIKEVKRSIELDKGETQIPTEAPEDKLKEEVLKEKYKAEENPQ